MESPYGCVVRVACNRTFREGSSRTDKDCGGISVVPVKERNPCFKGIGEVFSFDRPPLMDVAWGVIMCLCHFCLNQYVVVEEIYVKL